MAVTEGKNREKIFLKKQTEKDQFKGLKSSIRKVFQHTMQRERKNTKNAVRHRGSIKNS